MKKINFSSCFLIIIFFLNGCQDVKKGFNGKKLDQGNEFLVIKKNPLVVPPNFNEMPIPAVKGIGTSLETVKDSTDNDFKKLLDKKNKKQKKTISKKNSNNLEEKIIDKIK
tara:strand:+ start:98 stop:430 length:333 start_codon:yes stop_codon:yes gene_type:complete